MKISVSMYSLSSTIKKQNWTTVDFIEYANEISLDGVELLDIYWENPKNKDKEIDIVLNQLKKYNLDVSAYDITNNFVKESKNERDKEIEKVIEGIEIAKKLGTNILRVFCGDINGDLTFEQGQGWIIEGLKKCAMKAEEEGIFLAIENHGLLAGKAEQVKQIIEEVDSPFVKATFDTGNFLLVHEKPEAAFDLLQDDIVHVHFKDFRKKESNEKLQGFKSTKNVELIGVIPGEGQVNLSYVVEGLKKKKYSGWLSIEYEGHEDAKDANQEAVRRLRRLLK